MFNYALADYFQTWCETAVWFRKIVRHPLCKSVISKRELATAFIRERNRILTFCGEQERTQLRKILNKIAADYFIKMSHWSGNQDAITGRV